MKQLTIVLSGLIAAVLQGCSGPSAQDEIDVLLASMSLEEKVGEMTQLTIWPLLEEGSDPQVLDSAKVYNAIVNHHVGSILNVESYDYTVEQWAAIHKTLGAIAQHKPHKIPVLYGIDAIHGASYTVEATLYPQQIGQAASWDTAMAKIIGEQAALETRASGIPWTFSPVLDVARDPRWPRTWETYGESSVLSAWMGTAYVEGLQGGNGQNIDGQHVAACLKHFLGYSASLSGKDRTQAWIPERQLVQHYALPFQAAIDAGAASIMINSGDINGIPVHANPAILTDLLRNDMGFEGVAVTDWADIKYLFNRHRVAANYKEAVAMAINAGVDMSMVPDDLEFPGLLVSCVKEGLVSMDRINESVRRILVMKKKLGLFDNISPEVTYAVETHRATALKAAQNSLVLLKNEDNTLPLSTERVLVTGPTANSLIPLNGGWTHTWQGNDPTKANSHLVPTVAEAAQERGAIYVSSGEMVGNYTPSKALTAAAANSDVVVVCFGEWSYTEGVGDIEDMTLNESAIKLVEDLAAQGKTLIGVMISGRPRIIRDIEPLLSALIYAPLPGDYGGEAIAGALYGAFSPSGLLPFTFPRNPSAFIAYDYRKTDEISIAAGPDGSKGTQGFNPQYPFAHGLSYTSFDVSVALVDTLLETSMDVTIEVTNTGERSGRKTVPLFYDDEVASIAPSLNKLCGFAQFDLAPGETATQTITLSREDFAFVGQNNEWLVEPGKMKLKAEGQELGFTIK